MAILQKETYRFSVIPHENPHIFLHRNRKINPEIIWKHKRPQIAKAILNKISNAGDITIPDFKLYYPAIITKDSMALTQKQTYRPME
jgi:hypothetical protein